MRSLPRWLLRVVGSALAIAGVFVILRHDDERPGLPVYGQLGEFRFLDQRGREFGSKELRGHVWIADFIFTRCPEVCPAMTARMASLRPDLPEDVRLVSFSVDPGHDRPEVLAKYAERFDAGTSWHFLTGDVGSLHRFSTERFKLAAMEQDPSADGGPFLHSSKFCLVDAEGRIRGYYDSQDAEALTTLKRDARRLGQP